MKDYPHGLDEEILPEDLEIEQDIISRLDVHIEQGYAQRKPSLFKGLGKSHYAAGCYNYALDNPINETNDYLSKSLVYFYDSFEMGIPQQAYEFIKLLSLAIVFGNSDIAGSLAYTKRERYTNENVEVDEVVFVVAELLCAFVRQDEKIIARILERNDPDKIDANKIFRYERALYFPLLKLLDAVYKKDSTGFSAALQIRQADFVKFYRRADQKNTPEALIDMPGLAINAIARRRGLHFADNSVYRPSEIIRGNY